MVSFMNCGHIMAQVMGKQSYHVNSVTVAYIFLGSASERGACKMQKV